MSCTSGAEPVPDQMGADAAGALHDFNNALQAMGASLRRLERKIARNEMQDLPALTAAVGHQLTRVSTLGAALSHAASRPGSAASRVEPPVAIGPFLHAMVPQVEALLDESIRLELAVDHEAGHVACDPAQLESAIRNLVLNARDAMRGGDGVLLLRGRRIQFSRATPIGGAQMDGGEVPLRHFAEITVRDTGCGMGADMLQRCFDPFVSTKQPSGGTGLGLFQLRAFAERAGGSVRIDSREGHGTTATVLLPCRPAAPEAA